MEKVYSFFTLNAENLRHTKQTEKVYSFFPLNPDELEQIQKTGADDFEIRDGVLIKYHGTAERVQIPEGVNRIGDWAFAECSSLTEISIPDNVTDIGEYAFYRCRRLSEITVPDSVKSIGEAAFSGCEQLRTLHLPSLFQMKDGMLIDKRTGLLLFCMMNKRGGCIIPNGITSIGVRAFSWCSSLTEIRIPDSVTSIGFCAFSGCSSLHTASVPSGLMIPEKCFPEHCQIIRRGDAKKTAPAAPVKRTVPVPQSNDEFEIKAGVLIKYKGKAESVQIPDGVTSIGGFAFSECSSLTEISIPNSVTSIGNNAFWRCSSLTKISIPDSVTSIGDSAFSDCSSLTEIFISHNVRWISKERFEGCKALKKVSVPHNLKIPSYCFPSSCKIIRR